MPLCFIKSFILPCWKASCGDGLILSDSVVLWLVAAFFLWRVDSDCHLCQAVLLTLFISGLCLGLSWSCRSCTDSYIPILSFFFSFYFCSLSLKLPTFSVGYSSCLWLRFQSFTSGFRGVSVFFCFIWVYYHKEILMGQAEIKTRGTGSFKSVTI